MNIRYIEINGSPAAIPCPANASPDQINDIILDYLRYRGHFAANLVPVEDCDWTYPEGEYSEITIRIKNVNYQREESESE